MSFALLSFSFVQGVVAFFAPCAVALLPGYLAAFVARNTHTRRGRLRRAGMLAGLSILGLITIYALASILILLLNELIKTSMPYIAAGMGVLFILVGGAMLLGKELSLNIHVQHAAQRGERVEAYLFGVAYAVGALGCLFPLFLLVAYNAATAPSLLLGASYLIAYLFGISLFMLLFTALAVVAKEQLQRRLARVLPSVTRVAGGLMVAAGIYIVWYQSVLF